MKHRLVKEIDGHRVMLDRREQVVGLDVWEDSTLIQSDGGDAPIAPTLRDLVSSASLVSASVLAEKAKRFDDGLLAAVELAAQRGAGDFPGKRTLLAGLVAALAHEEVDQAIAVLLAAAKLGSLPVSLAPRAEEAVSDTIRRFLLDPLRSKPLGFYTWSPDLQAIFQQDRMLQGELHPGSGRNAIVRTLRGSPVLRSIYENYLELAARMTAPGAGGSDLRVFLDSDASSHRNDDVRFLPPSRSPEETLLERLYGGRSVPEGFNLVDELSQRIRRGEVDLSPRPESGWYDYQVWALEACVAPDRMPEGSHLALGSGYQEQLVDLFRGLVTLAREVHVKQIAIPTLGAPEVRPGDTIRIAPELRVEPLATYFLRRALSYRFVKGVLEDGFGTTALGSLHRLTSEGPIDRHLVGEVADMERLLVGAYMLVCEDLGMDPDEGSLVGLGESPDASVAFFQSWARDPSRDPDVGTDARAMVPLFYDPREAKIKSLLFLGWSSRPVCISFAVPPAVDVLTQDGRRPDARVEFSAVTERLPYPVAVEAHTSRILDRAEFRAHCDRYRTREAILHNLP